MAIRLVSGRFVIDIARSFFYSASVISINPEHEIRNNVGDGSRWN